MRRRRIPEATVSRLPVYLQALIAASDRGVDTISSVDLATAAGFNSAKVRKDLSYLGTYGTRGVGYSVAGMVDEISDVLGLTSERRVVIVGAGNLGRALASYGGFSERGFSVAALVDADESLVGSEVAGHPVQSLDDVAGLIADHGVTIAIMAIPATAAQTVADHLVTCGISAILNFAPAHLDVPDGVMVRRVDLSTELQILSFYERLGGAGADAALADGA